MKRQWCVNVFVYGVLSQRSRSVPTLSKLTPTPLTLSLNGLSAASDHNNNDSGDIFQGNLLWKQAVPRKRNLGKG